jgi:DNA-binding MarR family transcriptional regulator
MGPINALGYLLQHTATTLYRQSDQVLQERLGIGMSQFKLLMMLQYHTNVQQRMLADYLGQTEASISRQIKLLKTMGMLDTTRNPKNRREHITVLTARGIKITEAARDVLMEYHAPVFGQLSDKQQQQLTDLLRQLHNAACGAGRPHACENHDI